MEAEHQSRVAVALGYDRELPAPIVLAKGRGELADAIRRIASSSGIAVVEEPDLAQGLIEIDPGSFIPEEYYRIVAELLVFVGRVELRVGSGDRGGKGEGASAG